MTDEPKPEKDAVAAPAAADTDWGFPNFARDFPRHPALDDLVGAFTRGDYASVRAGAQTIASDAAAPADVKDAARALADRTKPDPSAKLLFLFAAALLVFLTAWWIMHDGPSHDPSAPATKPAVEYVN